MALLLLVIYWTIQVLQQILVKYGSLHRDYEWYAFIASTLVGVPAMFLIMKLYKYMQANLAYGLAVGGGFLACQAALMVYAQVRLSAVQWLAAAMIAVGMFIFVMAARTAP